MRQADASVPADYVEKDGIFNVLPTGTSITMADSDMHDIHSHHFMWNIDH